MKDDLKVNIYSVGDMSQMMEESQVSEQQRKEMLSLYHTTKQALEILSDISNTTISTGVPPPIIGGDDEVTGLRVSCAISHCRNDRIVLNVFSMH